MPPAPLPRLLVAEAFGVFLIVLLGCGAVVVNSAHAGAITHLGISLAFGVAVALAILIAAPWGGGDLNPAVTFARACTRREPWGCALAMMAAQTAGATLAAFLLAGLLPQHARAAATTTALPWWQALLIEAVLTFIMVRAARSAPAHAVAWVAGAAVALDALVGGPLTGASMNPARSFGPALTNQLADHDPRALAQCGLYAAGPAAGALAAFLLPLSPKETA